MVAKNDITGDSIRSKSLSDKGRDNWDRIFSKKKPESANYHQNGINRDEVEEETKTDDCRTEVGSR